MQLKSAAKLSNVIRLMTKHAGGQITFRLYKNFKLVLHEWIAFRHLSLEVVPLNRKREICLVMGFLAGHSISNVSTISEILCL